MTTGAHDGGEENQNKRRGRIRKSQWEEYYQLGPKSRSDKDVGLGVREEITIHYNKGSHFAGPLIAQIIRDLDDV